MNFNKLNLNIISLTLGLLVFSCATTKPDKPEIKFTSQIIFYSNYDIQVQTNGRLIGDNVFTTSIYILNNSSQTIYLNLENIVLININKVFISRISPDESVQLAFAPNPYLTDSHISSLRITAQASALRSGPIPPGTAVNGMLYWFMDFPTFPVNLNISIGQDVFQFNIAIASKSEFISNSKINEIGFYLNEGLSKMKLNDFQGAIQDYNNAIVLDSKYALTYLSRGVANLKLENYHDAIKDFNKAIELNLKEASVYFGRAKAKRYLQDYNGALSDFNKAIEINPNDENMYYFRGLTKSYLKEYQEAIKDYNKAIEINPKFDVAYFLRGIAKRSLEDYDGGCLDWHKAGELGYLESYDAIKEYCK